MEIFIHSHVTKKSSSTEKLQSNKGQQRFFCGFHFRAVDEAGYTSRPVSFMCCSAVIFTSLPCRAMVTPEILLICLGYIER